MFGATAVVPTVATWKEGIFVTLTIHKEEDEKRQLLVTVEVDESRVEKAMRATARKLAQDIDIPGFRKGRVPYPVMLRRFGKEAIRADSVEEMVSDIFEEMMDDLDVESYGQPTFDNMEMEPLVLKFTIPLTPTITLGDYRALRKEVEPVVVTDEALDEALEAIRTQNQELETVERAAEAGDVVVVSGKGVLLPKPAAADADAAADDADAETAETEPETETETERLIFDEDSVELLMDSEKVFVDTPFVDNVIGMSAGEEKTFSFAFPDEFEDEDLAGREANFEISVLEVKNRTLPELDDTLAEVDGRYETLDELRQNLRKQLQTQAETEARDALVDDLVDDLEKDAEIVYPPAALVAELDEMVESFKEQALRSGWEWADYLRMQSETEASLREQFTESAENRLRRRLLLREFILQEKITVGEADVTDLIEERVAGMGDNAELQESMRSFYREGYGFDMISSEVLMGKVYDRVKQILAGETPDLDAIAAAEAASADEEE